MYQLTVGDLSIDVVRKNIKNLHLAVYPPDGRVRIATPIRFDDEAVRLFALSKLSWIRRQQAGFAAQARQCAREVVSGESHYLWGRRYRLNVVAHRGSPRVEVRKTHLDLYVREGSTRVQREAVLLAWYRRELKRAVPSLLAKWQGEMNVTADAWGVKRMKTRWGTCNIEARRIWLNLELAKKPPHCLEYVVVHELVHLLERRHNERFTAHMDTFMANWRVYRDELNSLPLTDAK